MAGSRNSKDKRTRTDSAASRNAYRDDLYVDGSAVRKTLAVDFPEEQEDGARRRGHEYRTPGARRDAGREHGLGLGYTIGLCLACAVILYMCVGYLELQADNSATLSNIADLEEQLDELETENNDEYNRIISSVDLEEIREKAVNDLGMVYAGEDQVILYDGSENDYVTQYEDIPEETSGLSEVISSITAGD